MTLVMVMYSVPKKISSATELEYETIKEISLSLQKDILLFDLWVHNEDRTLSEFGGNSNLLWQNKKLHVIDHNLIFDDDFNQNDFWKLHVFRQANDFDLVERSNYQNKMQQVLKTWLSILDLIPQEWENEFNPKTTLQHLTEDANGNIWERLK